MTISTSDPHNTALLGVLGGSFDPVHFGHIKPTLEIVKLLGLNQVRLMPCNVSPFKDGVGASAQHRTEMLKIVAANVPEFHVDQRELSRPSPSYSIDSVIDLANDFPDRAICWLMGQDAFNSLPRWHRISEFMQLCHVVVAVRQHTQNDQNEDVVQRIGAKRCYKAEDLLDRNAGCAIFLQTSPVDVSSTQIRAMIEAGKTPQYLLPGGVWNYIKRNRLYGYKEI